MICCAIAALLVAVIAASRGIVEAVLARLRRPKWTAASLAAVLVLAGGSALAARHLDHAARGQADFAAMLMRHVYGGHSAPRRLETGGLSVR